MTKTRSIGITGKHKRSLLWVDRHAALSVSATMAIAFIIGLLTTWSMPSWVASFVIGLVMGWSFTSWVGRW